MSKLAFGNRIDGQMDISQKCFHPLTRTIKITAKVLYKFIALLHLFLGFICNFL